MLYPVSVRSFERHAVQAQFPDAVTTPFLKPDPGDAWYRHDFQVEASTADDALAVVSARLQPVVDLLHSPPQLEATP